MIVSAEAEPARKTGKIPIAAANSADFLRSTHPPTTLSDSAE
jgi:hypothetical protein